MASAPQGLSTGSISGQVLQTIQMPALNIVNPAVVTLPFNPVGGLAMPASVQVGTVLDGGFGAGKAALAGKPVNGGFSFGDKLDGNGQGVKDAQAKNQQPVISYSILSRIAHERDIQKENLSKLINMLFGKIVHEEDQDEDLEGMFGVWRDYLKRQREQKDQQQKEEQRKRKQKQDAELQEEELEAVMAV